VPDLNLLILPILGAYLLISKTHYFRFKQQLLDRQRLIFTTLLYSVYLLVLSFLISSIIKKFLPEFSFLILSNIPIKEKWIGTTTLSFLLGFTSPYLINIFFKDVTSMFKAIREVGNMFHNLLLSAFLNRDLVMITLTNGKVYIGFIDTLPEFNFLYFKLTPVFSGYRNSDHKLELSTNYMEAYQKLIDTSEIEDDSYTDLDNIEIALKTEEVLSSSIFDINLYKQFQDSASNPSSAETTTA